eukprot:Filipodium_phascolosomae@DN2754_c0_g2_i2.p1
MRYFPNQFGSRKQGTAPPAAAGGSFKASNQPNAAAGGGLSPTPPNVKVVAAAPGGTASNKANAAVPAPRGSPVVGGAPVPCQPPAVVGTAASPGLPAAAGAVAATGVDPKYQKLAALKAAIERKKDARGKETDERLERTGEFNKIVQQVDDSGIVNNLENLRLNAENEYLRATRRKCTLEDFETVKVVGVGAFGAVRLVKRKVDDRIFALKQMPKTMMKNKNQRERVIAERSVLASNLSRWIVGLEQTWQDDKCLYMLMEFLPGGDFMSHLIRLDIMTELQTQFYIAELVLAVDTVHELGYVHRDIKPDNMVLNADGHLKLLDFG